MRRAEVESFAVRLLSSGRLLREVGTACIAVTITVQAVPVPKDSSTAAPWVPIDAN
jgi:hypothetical protein